ncbi:MAG: peptide chain release factor-like protein [Verrucomicrobiota bacterium]
MNAFPVSQDKADQLARRMNTMGVSEGDLDETFVRSGGHGGQNVNKTSTCVMLLHRPTAIQVKCQSTRQQGLNRYIARQLLLDKIEALRKGVANAERARMEKMRRQKRGRSRGAKARMLDDKSRQARKKVFRKTVHDA